MGALIHKECGANCPACGGGGCPTWRYRVEPFQRAVASSGLTLQQVERICGWEGGYITRLLGLRKWKGRVRQNGVGRYKDTYATTLNYANAKKIAQALDFDLVEWEI